VTAYCYLESHKKKIRNLKKEKFFKKVKKITDKKERLRE
jgi:hypothetical protein